MEQNVRTQALWSRRSFLAGVGASSAVALAASYPKLRPSRTLLHVTTIDALGEGAIHSFAPDGNSCTPCGSLPSQRPVALAAHPQLPVLYVANDCSTWNHQPRATIEAFAVSAQGQPLRLLARRSLALSALGPRALAATADGRQLVVSSFDGGAWNAFSLDAHGMPSAHPASLKETGAPDAQGAHNAAHPFGLLAHGKHLLLFGSDYGADRLTILRADQDALHAEHRHLLDPGSGPAHLVLEPRSGLLLATTTLRPSLRSFQIENSHAPRLVTLDNVDLRSPVTALAAHPRAGLVYSADAAHAALTTWLVERSTGKLRLRHTLPLPASTITGLALESSHALWLTAQEGVFRISLAPGTGCPQTPALCLPLKGARSLLVQELPL